MAKYFVLLLLPACLLCALEDASFAKENVGSFKVKRDATFESETQLNKESNVHSRQRRAAEKKSYIFLDNRSGRTVQLYWRDIPKRTSPKYYTRLSPGQTIEINTYNTNEWTVKANGKSLLINGRQKLVQQSNTEDSRAIYLITTPGQRETKIGDKYIEMMVVVDKAAVEIYKNIEEVKRAIMTYLRLATAILQHRDLTKHGVKLHLVLSKLVLLYQDRDDVKLIPSRREDNLRKVCNFMNRIGNNGRVKFDHKLFLTKNGFGMGGYANNRGMCSQYQSCSMVYNHGFTASFLVAHEVAHSLGFDDKDFGQGSGYVMSQMVDARFDYHRWSTYSQISLLQNIRKFSCVNNKYVTSRGLPFVHKYPGVHFSFAKQCHLEYNKNYSAWKGRDDPCKKLKCQMPPPYTFLAKTTSAPALDGTECGIKKWCLSGTCTAKDGSVTQTVAATPASKQPSKVNGGWGEWRRWSRCSRTCTTGVQTRDRRCNKPLPRNGGRPCVGTSFQVRKCDTRKACPKSPSPRDTVCSIAGRRFDKKRRWEFYDGSTINTVNIDCTFESSTCRWTSGTTAGRAWISHKGKTPSSGTGPSADHTLKTARGTYVYLESSTTKAKAILSSPNIRLRQGCLKFWYHMWGDNQMGLLKVVKVGRGVSSLLWKQSGNRGNRWIHQAIDVQDSNTYKLQFIAKEKGRGYKSDIALDDITFRSGSCASQRVTQNKVSDTPCKIKCKTSDNRSPIRILSSVNVYDGTSCTTKTESGVCYQGRCKNVGCDNILTDGKKGNCLIAKGRRETQTKIATNSRSKSRMDCDFDTSYCQWRNMRIANNLNWLRASRGGKGYITPARHTSRQNGIKVATIVGPEVSASKACLSFSYHLSLKGGWARLRVKTLANSFARSHKYLSRSTDGWKDEKIEIQMRTAYQVIFEATVSSRNTGLIAIDNIRFDPGRCS